jgi:hypothetical protein
MANKLLTVFQNLDRTINGTWDKAQTSHNNTYNMSDISDRKSHVIYKASSKEDYEKTKLEMQQNTYLKDRWVKANVDLTVQAFNGLNNIKLMYRDADLMDAFPEIGAALDTMAEESCVPNTHGQIITVHSKSDRVKNILEDLFINRLDIQVIAPMVIRAMCKYGNQFMLLNVDSKLGVIGWRQLPVYEVERLENGIANPYGGAGIGIDIARNNVNDKDLTTKFVWTNETNNRYPFRDWQIAHFRLITNQMYLPYGVSALNAGRRHFRMLSLMEDMMLIYRLERSVERRVYKIFVGAIDDADVEAYVEDIANNFKRTPVIDPMTGQIDLRKNLLDISQDLFIPVRDASQASPIETLPAAQNLTAIDDIKFVQNKLLTALRIPKSFLNFEETTGDGKNLALMDIRFVRTVNRFQQAFLMEMTKIASIHLYLLGFTDDLTNFTLSMTNPSTQSEQLEIENIQKKVGIIRDAVSDPGNGISVMSLSRALKEIMKWSDKEIQENFEEIRLEKALATELEKTSQIIKKTGIFDNVDRIYGEPGAKYQDDQQQGNQDEMGGMMGGGGGGGLPPMDDGGFGGDIDELGEMGADENGEISGNEGEVPMGGEEGGGEQPPSNEQPPMENLISRKMKPLLNEIRKKDETSFIRTDVYDKSLMINEEFDKIISSIDGFLAEKKK